MQWEMGNDRILRAEKQDVSAAMYLTDMRSRWNFKIYKEGILVFKSGPYIQARRARKAAEEIIERFCDASS